MSVTIGAVTIGQSPRDDVVPVVEGVLGGDVTIVQCGALDGMDAAAVRREAPKLAEGVLVTRMRDGTALRVRREFLIPRIKHCIHSIQDDCALLLLLCTDPFSGLESNRVLLLPGLIMTNLVVALGIQRIGILTPVEEQINQQLDKWGKVVRRVFVSAASPYEEPDRVPVAAEALARENVEMVVMDCIGYTPTMKAEVSRAVKRPVLLPSTILAHTAAELLAGW